MKKAYRIMENLENKKFGFVGMGNMAQALVSGLKERAGIKAGEILAFAPNKIKLEENAGKLGFRAEKDLECLVRNSDIIILACKPYQVEEVLDEINNIHCFRMELYKMVFYRRRKHKIPVCNAKYSGTCRRGSVFI